MQTTKHPYEFLVRWDRAGRLSGAHTQFRYVTVDENGSVLGELIGAAEAVGVTGFPLSDILSQLQIAALTECEAMRAERDALAEQLNAGGGSASADQP